MDHLWAPWRMEYIRAGHDSSEHECFICRCWNGTDDRDNLVVYRQPHTIVVLNRYPYNNGHLLLAPAEHKGDWDALTDTELLEAMRVMGRMLQVLQRVLSPDGFNIGLNLGRVAGAGLPGHLHWHIVPRWNGDTNFMPVVSQTHVIVQSLQALYDLLRAAL